MTSTLGAIRGMVASRIPPDTVVTPFDLVTWINDGARDIARRTETLEAVDAIAWTAGNATQAVPTDLVRAHRCEFVDSSGLNTYLVELFAKQELDQVWGILHTQQSSYPSYGYLYGFQPNTVLGLFQVPAQNGTINLEYYRYPAAMAADNDPCEIVNGWEDLIVDYVEIQVLKRDRDPLWAPSKQLYDEKIAEMTEKTRNWHDQAGVITVGNRQVPSWLYDFDF